MSLLVAQLSLPQYTIIVRGFISHVPINSTTPVSQCSSLRQMASGMWPAVKSALLRASTHSTSSARASMSRISPGANTGSAQGKGASPLHSENAAPNMVSAVMVKISRRNLGISEQARATEGASKLAHHDFCEAAKCGVRAGAGLLLAGLRGRTPDGVICAHRIRPAHARGRRCPSIVLAAYLVVEGQCLHVRT